MGSWRISAHREAGDVDVRFRLAEGPEIRVSVYIRYSRSLDEYPHRIHARQIDQTTFATEAAIVHRSAPRVSLQLNDAPAEACAVLRSL
jgi:hypothetical protein